MNGGSRTDAGFGRRFTDHMAVARFDARSGWTDTEIVSFATLTLSPAAMALHYGQSVFEGLKAFRQPDGSVALFRAHDHAARLDRSARQLVMPELATGTFVEACSRLVRADLDMVPSTPDHSLYLRPMLLATEAALGVRPAAEYLFVVIASPVGAYVSTGAQPMTVWASRGHSRAAPGGTGSAKCAGNYAASLAGLQQAAAHGCGETLWLDSTEHRWIEELSGMNVVLVATGRAGPALVTPPAGGTILDGITRRSLLVLGRSLGLAVVERPVALEELCDGRSFVEAFACGTAAGVVPFSAVRSASGLWPIGNGEPGTVSQRLHETLLAIQEGRASDPYGWRMTVAEGALSDDRLTSGAGACQGQRISGG
jgi:branched-chain amino acid aminotransferase